MPDWSLSSSRLPRSMALTLPVSLYGCGREGSAGRWPGSCRPRPWAWSCRRSPRSRGGPAGRRPASPPHGCVAHHDRLGERRPWARQGRRHNDSTQTHPPLLCDDGFANLIRRDARRSGGARLRRPGRRWWYRRSRPAPESRHRVLCPAPARPWHPSSPHGAGALPAHRVRVGCRDRRRGDGRRAGAGAGGLVVRAGAQQRRRAEAGQHGTDTDGVPRELRHGASPARAGDGGRAGPRTPAFATRFLCRGVGPGHNAY